MILIADDDRVFSHLLASRLQRRGLKVVAAMDCMQTIMIAQRQPLDLIILDIAMPGGGGISVLQRLKASLKTNMIPIIVVSGSADEKLIARARELGAEQYLPKPLDFDALDKMLDGLLPSAPAAKAAS